ncbi:MAG: heterodisulfide reductase-related iron-sulfur binding cluster, partial [Planctomycetota bacterium]|nr:heterodisulfide reductase-related iron-sulfur binding cluster [Planctomycetota bacterium]
MNGTQSCPAPSDLASIVDYAASLDCIHCGLCLEACPTYTLTGREGSSPRGRIHAMRAVGEGRLEAGSALKEELSFCLGCRRCESLCPAGARYGHMLSVARDSLAQRFTPWPARLVRFLSLRLVVRSRLLLSGAASTLRLCQRSGLFQALARLFPRSARLAALAALPAVPARAARRPLPPLTPATAPGPAETDANDAEVAMLEGCVMPELLGRVNRATARTIAAAGSSCRTAPGHVCCGALNAHNGDLAGARALARTTMDAFDALTGAADAPLTVVVNSAGCGAHMKEYVELFEPGTQDHARALAFASRVRDYAEWLAPRLPALVSPTGIQAPVAYDDPCHLCHGQGIRSEPRAILDALPGVQRVEMEDSEACCGSAGTYALQRPEDAQAVFASRERAFGESGAGILVTANPGCALQWIAGLATSHPQARVLHLAEVVEQALVEQPDELGARWNSPVARQSHRRRGKEGEGETA